MFGRGIVNAVAGALGAQQLHGTVVLMTKNVLDLNDFNATILDGLSELLGNAVGFSLVSATVADPKANDGRGLLGSEAHLELPIPTLPNITAGEAVFKLTFNYDSSFGIPGTVIVRNRHPTEFFLKTLAIDNVPGKGRLFFACNSWVYPNSTYNYDRVFFTNDTYLPEHMPAPLRPYRDDDFVHLRGDKNDGPYKTGDRVYRYAYYNDLGEPDRGPDYARPVLGGSSEHPYPRRGRTGRAPTKTDPETESRLNQLDINIYVPRDERFGHIKLSDFLGYSLKAIAAAIIPLLQTILGNPPNEFKSFQDILNLYEGGIKIPDLAIFDQIKNAVPFELIKVILPSAGERLLKMPIPQVIAEDKLAWRTDEEFAREMLAGVNPVVIKRLESFPPRSGLDPTVYGDHSSTIAEGDIEKNMDGVTVQQALQDKRLFILDHYDHFMVYLNRINSLKGNYIYASRTLVFLKEDGTLKPIAIELSLPHPDGQQYGAVSKVFTPADSGVEGSVWQLAKAYACVDDSGYHQLISHWLNTHAAIEPFVIATHRQLSVTHPIHKLLSPHYRDTMNINALARQLLISAGGIFELTVFPRKYALELSSVVYKSWNFTEQSLPDELLKRGMAVEDPARPGKLKLVIEDYPYAVDGLEVWGAIEEWVDSYCAIYYPNDGAVRGDVELQAWWKEVREEGHGDLKDAPWWPEMQTVTELRKACATIIWVASALHAAVNFGQYPYAGYLPNRPTVSRRAMPEPGTEAYAELKKDPDTAFIRTITNQFQTILGISLIEILSKHSSDEVYLGQRDTPEWTSDTKALEAFRRFGERLMAIEKRIVAMNGDPRYKNRNGPVKFPYMLLFPNTSDTTGAAAGLTAKGIPNSISI